MTNFQKNEVYFPALESGLGLGHALANKMQQK